jgi:glycosyltransferase involved in cell wall biosynthesis
MTKQPVSPRIYSVLAPSKPDVSVLIPTLDEAPWIRHTITAARASAAAAGVGVEIIVCDGGSRDDTVDEARRAGADAVVVAERASRAHQINRGLERARAETLGFLHADTLLRPEAFVEMLDARARGYSGGWFQLEILPELGASVSSNFLATMAWGINLRTRLFRTATADQFIFAGRDVLDVLGGLPEIPLFEGNRFARLMRDIGDVVVLGPQVRISGRRWERNGLLRMLFLMYALRAAERAGAPTQTLYELWCRLSSK